MSNRRKQARPSKLEDGGEFSAAAAEKETKSEDDLTGEEAMEEDEDEDDNYRDICHGKDVEDANNNESKSQDGSIDKEDLDEGETKERLTEAIQNLIGNFPWGSNNQPGNNSAQQGISLEAIQNTKAAMTQLTQALQNDQNSIQELAVLQSTLYTLQQQQILQLQLIQQLQHQLHVSNSAENSQHPDNNSSMSSPSPNSPEETLPILEVVKEKSPQPSEMNKKDGLNPHFASLLNCANQDPNRPLSPGLMGGCDGGRGKGEEDVNTLEMLQKRAQEVLDSASQGLLASSLADDPNYRKKSGLGPYDKGREPFFKHRCRYCGKVFGSDSALQIHIRSHTGERPFKCNVCGSRFTTKGNLKVHFQRHTSKFPHVKMNPHPVPEHLDHFHPPLLSSGQTTPEHSPTFNIFNPFVPFRFDCPQDLRKPDGLENGDKLTSSSSKEFPEDFSNSKAGDDSSCHAKVLGMMEDHVSSSKEYKENGSSRDNYPESRVEDLRKEEQLQLHDHHHEHERHSSSHPHHHHHHPHHNKHHHHITSQALPENQRRVGRERERERERGQTADESSHDDDEELRNIEENKECEREIMLAESREREREEKEIKEMVKERLREKENNNKDFEKLPEKEKEIEPEKFNENSSHGDKCERWSNEPEIKEEFVSSDENEDDADFAEQPENLSSKSLPLMFPIPLQSLPVRPSSLNTTPLSPHHKFDPAKDPAIYTNLLPRPGSNDNAWESLIEVTKTSETTKLQQLVDNIEHKLTDPNQCIICHRVLSCKSALQMHYRTHTGERPFKCKICGRAFTTKGNLKTHMGVHRAKPPLRVLHQCPVCHKRFTNSLVLQQHIRLHTGEPTDLTPDQIRAAEVKDYPILPFNNQMFSPGSAKYDISDDSSSSEKDEQTLLLQQTQLQPPPPSFQSSIAALESQVHRMNYFDNNPTDLSKKESCNDRDSVVSDGDTGGGSGVLDLSKSVTESPPAVPPLPVFGHLPILPITQFDDNQFLWTGRGNTTCNICLKTFACNSALEIHYRSHTKERPFKCTVCDRGFSTKGNMKQHMLTHKIRDMPEKNGQSSDCDDSKDSHNSSFQRRSSEVVSPSSVSEGSCTKKRPCEEPEELTTNKKLASGGGLSSELTMDGGERASKHVCNVCTKSFSSSSSLHIHMRTHTGDKPFKCNVCSKAFTTKGNLKVHMGTHMWTNGASRRGRRMSLELPLGLHFPPPPPPPPQPAMKDVEAAAVLIHHHHHQHRRPQDLFYPYLPPSHLIVNNHLNHKPRDEAISSSSLSPPSGSPQNGLTIPKENISSD